MWHYRETTILEDQGSTIGISHNFVPSGFQSCIVVSDSPKHLILRLSSSRSSEPDFSTFFIQIHIQTVNSEVKSGCLSFSRHPPVTTHDLSHQPRSSFCSWRSVAGWSLKKAGAARSRKMIPAWLNGHASMWIFLFGYDLWIFLYGYDLWIWFIGATHHGSWWAWYMMMATQVHLDDSKALHMIYWSYPPYEAYVRAI